jgi:AraC-like DNA-binding protein
LSLLLLLAVIMLVWLLLETRRMKGKIERILDLTVLPDIRNGEGDDPAEDDPSTAGGYTGLEQEGSVTDSPPARYDVRDSWPAGKKMISKVDRELLARIDEEIDTNLQDSEYTIEMLRTRLGISRSGLYKKLIYLTGRSPLEYIRIKRLQKGREMLESGETSVSQIAWSVGFSPKQFSKYFKDEYGCLPSEYIHYLTD